jgi:hypothetical protein
MRRRADRCGTRELVEEGHLAEHVTGLHLAEPALGAVPVLERFHPARPDDERADPGVALADDVLPGGVALLDRGVRDRLERLLVQVLEQADVLQEVDIVGRHRAGA